MAALHGKGGKVKISTNTVAELDNWSLDIDRDEHEVTAFGDSGLPFKRWVAGLVGATGKFGGRLDMTDTNGQVALFGNLTSDSTLSVDFYLDATHKFATTLFVKKFGAKAPIGDMETVDWDVRITNAIPVYS